MSTPITAKSLMTNATKRATQFQFTLPGLSGIEDAVAQLADSGIEERGAIFTKREVVDFLLDLAGYTADQPLHTFRILEPSFGGGDFLLPIVERLVASTRKHKKGKIPWHSLSNAIRGVELHKSSFRATGAAIKKLLAEHGCSARNADGLVETWLRQEDFLLSEHSEQYTHIVGNPPYVRQEMVSDTLIAEYRRRFTTIYDRADLYVPFIEHALNLLSPGSRLAFICADRWMKNKYGGPLRKLIADNYHFTVYVDMVDTPAFHSDVIAYPAIFVVTNEASGPTRIAHRPSIDAEALKDLASKLTSQAKNNSIIEIPNVAAGAEPWILDSLDQLAVVRRLERDFPLLEDVGCKVGIGVATGNDSVFMGAFDTLDVEPDRKLPIVTTRDIVSGGVKWRGNGVLNPFMDDGTLAPLSQYPRFAKYLKVHGEAIRARHVSKKNPGNWYRTIDRIYPALVHEPKLLIPDIKGEANIVYEEGKLYPHHNLYYVTSTSWDLLALRTVLRSGIAKLFISTYSTKMRGGYLRFQAQYLRRIRLPKWETVPKKLRATLKQLSTAPDPDACDVAIAQLYGLSTQELAMVRNLSSTQNK